MNISVHPYTLPVCCMLLLSWLMAYLFFQKKRRYPPGPPGKLIVGNLFDVPRQQGWKTFDKWAKTYGPVIYLNAMGRHLVILNTDKTCSDLLEKRGNIYSERPLAYFNSELVDRKHTVFYISASNPRFARYRKMMNSSVGNRAARQHWGMQEREASVLLGLLASNPHDFIAHVRRNAGAIILKIAYGYTLEQGRDPFVDRAEEGIYIGKIAAAPGRWLVDSLPILRFVPAWFPGASFQSSAKEYRKRLQDLYRMPVDWVKEKMASGHFTPSFTSELLAGSGDTVTEEDEDVILNAAGALYAGGADTTVSAMTTFICMMMLHRQVQAKAQEELDRVVGRTRLPTLADRPNLPYLECVIKEVLRWHPPGPLGIPHSVAQNDEYNGYVIPAGATVISNIWAILHNDEIYPKPYDFNPERFIEVDGEPAQPDPRRYAFGYGKRICPGMYLAEAALFINVACILATLDIGPAKDEAGANISPELTFSTGIVSHIEPFPCQIKVRPGREHLIP